MSAEERHHGGMVRRHITVNGTLYGLVADELDMRTEGDRTVFDAGRMAVVDECEHCHRFDMAPDLAYSWDEVIEKGWVVAVDDD